MSKKAKVKATLKEALAELSSVAEVDDQIVAFVKGKKAKFKFFLESGRTTAITMMVVPAILGVVVGYLVASAP